MGNSQSQQVQQLTTPLAETIERLKAALAENEQSLILSKRHNKELEAELERKSCVNCIQLISSHDEQVRAWEEEVEALNKVLKQEQAEVEEFKGKLEEEQVQLVRQQSSSHDENQMEQRISELEFDLTIIKSCDPPETQSQNSIPSEELELLIAEVRAKYEKAEEENLKQISEMFELGEKLERASVEKEHLKEQVAALSKEKQTLAEKLENCF
jgi:predicted RNase H-like nuclease (RuvC/YqgF family)